MEIKTDEEYWVRVMKNRMPERDEVVRLVTVLKGFHYTHLEYALEVGKQPEELLDFWDSNRPYGSKNVPASIAFNLGWDVERRLCKEYMPIWVEEETKKLHQKVKDAIIEEQELKRKYAHGI